MWNFHISNPWNKQPLKRNKNTFKKKQNLPNLPKKPNLQKGFFSWVNPAEFGKVSFFFLWSFQWYDSNYKPHKILHYFASSQDRKENPPWNRSDINFQKAPNQFEFSTLMCIFVPNSGLSFHLEQSGKLVAVKCWTMYLNWAIQNSLLKVRLRVNSLIGVHQTKTVKN